MGLVPVGCFLQPFKKGSYLFRRYIWRDSCDSGNTWGTTIDRDRDLVTKRGRHDGVGHFITVDCCNPRSAPLALMRISRGMLSSTDKPLPSELAIQRTRPSIHGRNLTSFTLGFGSNPVLAAVLFVGDGCWLATCNANLKGRMGLNGAVKKIWNFLSLVFHIVPGLHVGSLLICWKRPFKLRRRRKVLIV